MKILFLLTQDLESPSGLGRHFPVARELVKLGHQVTMAALHSNYQSLERKQFIQEGIQVKYVGQMQVLKQGNQKVYFPWYKLLFVSARGTIGLFFLALFQDADIIQICKPHPMNSLAGLLAGRLRNRRVFLDCDDFEAASVHYTGKWQRRVVTWFENHVPLYVDHVTTHTFFFQDFLLRLGIPQQQVTYIPNGIDTERFRPPADKIIEGLREKYDLCGKKVVLFVGSLSRPSHPVHLLLDAFKLVIQSHQDCVLLIIGGGDDFEALTTQVEKAGLTDAVRFCGRVAPNDVPAYYRLGDISVDPVYDDDIARGRSPLKLFESWISGVPFITGDVGDRALLMGDPPAGLLAPPGDHNALASGIIRLLENPELAAALQSRGLERVRNYYWSNIACKVEGIITSPVQT